MRTARLALLALALALASAGSASAATVTTSCAGLQTALDNANTGDTVVLQPNPAPAPPLCTGVTFTYSGDQSFTLEGQTGAGFDGTGAGRRPLSFTGASSPTTLTLQNLIFENGDQPSAGGAVAFQGPYSVTLDHDTFTNNQASPSAGGAVDVETTAVGTAVTLSNDTFSGNQVGGGGSGGAVSIAQSGAGDSMTLSGDTFTSNQTTGGGQGGAVEILAGGAGQSLSVSGSTFTGNTTNSSGGAIDVFTGSPIAVTMTGNVFSGNAVNGCGSTCELDGGGVSINSSGVGPAGVTQSGNTFTGNTVTGSNEDATGGGEAVIGEPLTSTGDLFTQNSLQAALAGHSSLGAALAIQHDCGGGTQHSTAANLVIAGNAIGFGGAGTASGALSSSCIAGTSGSAVGSLTLTNATISGNSGGGGTAGIWGEPQDQLTLQNSILNGDSAGVELTGFSGVGGSVTATYTDLCNRSSSNPFTGTGNICANPQLVNASGGNVRETSSSPTIDVGSNSLVPGGLTTDVYGAARIQPKFAGGTPIVDMGAAEFPTIVPPTPPPTASIASPSSGAVYATGQTVPASYSCTEGSGGPGISSCTGDVTNGSPIDTSTTGAHTFTVTATSRDGQTGTTSVSYTVTSASPSVSIASPAQGAFYAVGQRVVASYACTDAAGGPGISSCAGPVASGSPIDTSSTGVHTFTVIPKTSSGQSRTASVTYTVAGAPTIASVAPLSGARYIRGNSSATASFACSEGASGPGLSSCVGTVPNGSAINTDTPGPHTFTVTARSSDGQVTTASIPYEVVYPSNKPVRPPHNRPHSDGRFIVTVKVPHRGRVDILVTAWKDNFAPGFGPAADIGPPKPVILQPAARRFVFARAHMTFGAPGTYQILVTPNAAGSRLVLHHRYRVTLRLWISYTPWGGFPGKLGYFGLHLP